jgi:hypothetical protein
MKSPFPIHQTQCPIDRRPLTIDFPSIDFYYEITIPNSSNAKSYRPSTIDYRLPLPPQFKFPKCFLFDLFLKIVHVNAFQLAQLIFWTC